MMSLLEKLDLEMTPSRENLPIGQRPYEPDLEEADQQIGSEVAHDLNSILAIIQSYAERLMMDHWQEPEMHVELQMLIDNARNAAGVVRCARQRVPGTVSSLGWGLVKDGEIHQLPGSEPKNRVF